MVVRHMQRKEGCREGNTMPGILASLFRKLGNCCTLSPGIQGTVSRFCLLSAQLR